MNSYKENSFLAVPFVFVVDRSGSMQNNGGIDLINQTLRGMMATLREIPEVEESASVGLISFANSATVHSPIQPLRAGFEVPSFRADGTTSYAAPLRALRTMIAD